MIDQTAQPVSRRGGRMWVLITREIRENLRQRWLVAALAMQFGAIGLGASAILTQIDWLARLPNGERKIAYWGDVLGVSMSLDGLMNMAVSAVVYLVLTQLLGMTAVLAGHAALHDRQCGTLPFLLLAPVRRTELLVGKVVGAVAVPWMLYVLIGGATLGWAATLSVADSQAALLPPAPGFFVAFFLGAPIWSMCIGAVCVTISSLAHDVRTAQQASWLLVFVATFVVGPLLVNLMPLGPMVQLIVALIGLLCAAAVLGVGTLVISRELGR